MSRKHEDHDHRADQLNPNNEAYWTSRGYDERPDDWEERIADEADQADTKNTQA